MCPLGRRATARAIVVAGLLSGPASAVFASGFLLHDQSASGLAQGGAVVAAPVEPAAVWFNPAVLGFSVDAGLAATGALVAPHVTFSDGIVVTESRPRLRPAPNLFAHVPVAFPWTGRAQLGLGLHVPFALALDWPRGWVGADRAESVHITAVASSWTLSLPLGSRVAVGVGASLLHGQIRLGAALPSGDDANASGRADISARAWDWNGTVALAASALPRRLHLGLVYRTGALLRLHGDARFSGTDPRLGAIYQDQSVTLALPLPWSLNFGLAAWPAPGLRLGTEVDYVGWGAFARLDVRFSAPTTPPRIIERDAQNALTVRQGIEWQANMGQLVALRAGLSFTQATARAETLSPAAPDANRIGVAIGAGFECYGLSLDVGYLYLHFLPAEVTVNREGPIGTYRAAAHVVSLTAWKRIRSHGLPRTP